MINGFRATAAVAALAAGWPFGLAVGQEAATSTVTCGAKAALFGAGEKGPRVWVLRRGELERDNPLRPLTPDRLLVLQVVVNGRLATAWGPDHEHLRQGGAPQDLERNAAEPIRWANGPDGLSERLRVVAEDGSVLIGDLRFRECADPPKARAVAPARRAETSDKPNRKAAEERSRPRPNLPQGAMEGPDLAPR